MSIWDSISQRLVARPAGWIALLLVGCPLTGLTACTAEVHSAQPTVVADDEVEVETMPANVYTYPHTEYRGQTVYYVNGRWYKPRGKHWSYYRNEPPELVHHRSYVQEAPPARRAYEPRPGEAERVR